MPSSFQSRRTLGSVVCVLLCLTLMSSEDVATRSGNPAADAFRNPPDSSRMTTYWIWIGPAVTAEQVDRDLLNMKAAGIGGVVLLPIYPLSPDDPDRGIRNRAFLSPEFLDVVAYGARRAEELGMTFGLTLGTGWPFGGPSVTAAETARKISMAEIPLAKGQTSLQLPEPRAGDHVERVFLNANGSRREVAVSGARTISVPDGVRADSVVIFTSSPTGQTVKRPALGADGLVVDHLSGDALRNYLKHVGEPLAGAVRHGGVSAYWMDSLEVYGGNWTPHLLERFRERREYDLGPLLPTLFGQVPDETTHLRYDYWRTVSELAETEFLKPLQEWAHAKGALFQAEPYGQPPVSLNAARYVDLPVGEHYEWKMFNACRWTASGAWLFGRPVIGAEAYTWLGVPNRFGDTLEDMKLVSDMHFLSGINSLMSVSYVLTPPAAHLTRWSPYWGPVFNDQQTWWDHFPLLSRYVQRVSHVLQQGVPVADVGLFLPSDDALAHSEMTGVPIEGTTGIRFERAPSGGPGFTGMNLYFAVRDILHGGRIPEFGMELALNEASPIVESLVTSGYSFGGIDSFALPGMRIQAGRLQAGVADYGVVVLPGLMGMRLEAMEKLAQFSRQGGTVIATKRLPDTAYGWKGRKENTAKLRAIVREMFGEVQGKAVSENAYGRGKAIFVNDQTATFRKALEAAMQPDILFEPHDTDVSFVHRRSTGEDFYFVTNLSTDWKKVRATFRVGHREPQMWDPMSGDTRAAVAYAWKPEGTQIRLRLEPYGSTIVYFGASTRPALLDADNLQDLRVVNGSLLARADLPGGYFVSTDQGRSTEQHLETLPSQVPVNGAWRFATDEARPTQIAMAALKSWTEFSATRFFAGRGIYRTEVTVPASYVDENVGVRLDLGAVGEVADVRVNGRPAGVAWKRPYVLDVTGLVRPGQNSIEVRVTNLLINRLLGMGPPDYRALRKQFGERFPDPQEWKVAKQPVASGLLGPVNLVPYAQLKFRLPAAAPSRAQR